MTYYLPTPQVISWIPPSSQSLLQDVDLPILCSNVPRPDAEHSARMAKAMSTSGQIGGC